MPRGGAAPPCEKHHIQDCLACMLAGKTATAAVPKLTYELAEAQPPDNVEGWLKEGSDALDKAQEAKGVQPRPPIKVEPGKTEAMVSFDTLPTDDSRASRITRAAAGYAKASENYAKAVVAVENLRSQLMVEEAKLHKASEERKAAEAEMQELTNTAVA